MASTPRQTLGNQVYEYLLAQLVSGKMPVGTHLNAPEIAKQLDVSRTTVDKAITRLIGAEWVQYNENRQPIVAAQPEAEHFPGDAEFEFLNQTDRAYHAIIDQIIRRELQPGQIIKEHPLAQELGLNRSNVRQAAERLNADGLLLRLPRRGWQVVCLDQSDAAEIQLIREYLEPIVVAGAVEHMSDETIEELMSDTEKILSEGESSDPLNRRLVDLKFHCTLCDSSGHRIIAETLIPLFRKIMLTLSRDDRTVRKGFLEHKAVLEALLQRDKDKAVKAIMVHLRTLNQRNLERFPEAKQE